MGVKCNISLLRYDAPFLLRQVSLITCILILMSLKS